VVSRESSNVFSVDPAQPTPPEGLEAPEPGTGAVVAVLADQGARASGWSAPLAIALAAAWADDGSDVVLADGDLAGAELHALVGAENDEGVADVIVYGASMDRVLRPGSKHAAVQFVPAGTAVFELSIAYGHARWAALFSALRDARATLVLYLPAEAEGVSSLAEQADRVIRLVSGTPTVEWEAPTAVICGPPWDGETVAPEAAVPTPLAATGSATAREPLVRTGVAPSGPAKGGRGKVLLLILLVIALALLVAAALGYITL
jgi:hypothetical protein